MRKRAIYIITLLMLLTPAVALSDNGTDGDKAGLGLSLRYEFLRREDITQRENYYRFTLAWDSDNRFINPRGGVEVRLMRPQVRSYWLGDDIRVTRRLMAHARFNHLEYGDWQTAINHLNAYISYKRWWLRVSVGIGYAAIIFEPDNYQNPFLYNSEVPETRFIYNISIHPTFFGNKLELDAGLKNFDNFEYHGLDDNGYHIEAIWNVSDNTSISYFYERRYAAFFISVPHLVRTTWIISVTHRF